MNADNRSLLREFTERHSQDAFVTLIRRQVNLVYSTALRVVRSRPLAEDVAQSVFTDLARDAGKLKPDTVLTAWLYRVAYRTAVDVVRRQSRRQRREQQAVEIAAMNSSDVSRRNPMEADWTNIEPLLDEAMQNLDETDRAAVLLRYFENQSLREVGEKLGVSDDAAQKRVSRAVERLREFFAKRGVAIGTGGLAVAITGHAVQAAPVGLAATIAAGATVPLATGTLVKAVAMTTMQKAVITAAVLAATGAIVYQARRISVLQDETQRVGQPPVGLVLQNQQLLRERNEAQRELKAAQEQLGQSSRDAADVASLQNEVTRLSNELAQVRAATAGTEDGASATAAKTWLSNVERFKQALDQSPENKIPELQFLTDPDWLDAARGKLETENDFRRAFAGLRNAAQSKFAGMAGAALAKYLKASNGQFPTALSQLQPYFKSPVDAAILDRYEIVPAEDVPSLGLGGDWVITQKAVIDEDYDLRVGIGPRGYGNATYRQSPMPVLIPVRAAFLRANNGQEVTDPSQLLPYVKTPPSRPQCKDSRKPLKRSNAPTMARCPRSFPTWSLI